MLKIASGHDIKMKKSSRTLLPQKTVPHMYIVHGFIGFGKTTFAKNMAEKTGAKRLSMDETMIEMYGTNPPQEAFAENYQHVRSILDKKIESLVQAGDSVILDWGFWTREDRDAYRAMAERLGAKVVLYSVQCSFDVAKERVRKRSAKMPEGALFIDDNAMDTLWERFEPLQEDEERIDV